MTRAIIQSAGLTDVGLKRAHNEDSFVIYDIATRADDPSEIETDLNHAGGALLVVADGMGGAAAGEVASRMCVDILKRQLQETVPGAGRVGELGEILQSSARQANSEIHAQGKSNKKLSGMGTTLTGALCIGDLLLVTQVGDSRAYVLRKGELTQVTRDQSLVGQMIYEGKMSAEDARAKLPKNVILQAVGKKETVEPVLSALEIRAGDQLLLCSDGLSNLVKDEELAELVGKVADPNIACQALVDLAKKRGGDDNITVVIAKFSGDLAAADDGMIPFYEDVLTERGDEPIFDAAVDPLDEATVIRAPATTRKLPPDTLPSEPEPPRLAFDVDEALGLADPEPEPAPVAAPPPPAAAPKPPPPAAAPKPPPPPAAPSPKPPPPPAARAPEPPPAAPEPEPEPTPWTAAPPVAPQPSPEPEPEPEPAPWTASPPIAEASPPPKAKSEDLDTSFLNEPVPDSGMFEDTLTDAPAAPTQPIPRPSEFQEDPPLEHEPTKIHPISSFDKEAPPETPPPPPEPEPAPTPDPEPETEPEPPPSPVSARVARSPSDGRFVHKPAAGDGPWQAKGEDSQAMERFQDSLNDSGIFKRSETGAQTRVRAGGLMKLLVPVVFVGVIAVASVWFFVFRDKGPEVASAPPTAPIVEPSPSPTMETPPVTDPDTDPDGDPDASDPSGTDPAATDPGTEPIPVEATPEPSPDPPPSPKPPPTPKATPTPTPSPAAVEVIPGEPLEGTGYLKVSSDPTMAYVKVNGELRGVTPMELELPLGEPLNLLVYRVGFESHHDPAFMLTQDDDKLAVVLTSSR